MSVSPHWRIKLEYIFSERGRDHKEMRVGGITPTAIKWGRNMNLLETDTPPQKKKIQNPIIFPFSTKLIGRRKHIFF